MCRKLFLLTSFVLVLGLLGSASASQVVDDFESGNLNIWEITEGPEVVTIGPDPTEPSNNCLVFSPGDTTMRTPWGLPEGNAEKLSYRLMYEMALGGTVTLIFGAADPADTAWGNYYAIARMNSYGDPANIPDMDVRDGGAYTDVVQADLEPLRWYDIMLDIDTASKTYDAYIDGVLVYQGAAFRSGYSPANLEYILLRTTTWSNNFANGTVYVDDIVLGEPGATITVEAGGDIAAANAAAVAGDIIDIAAGTFVLTGQIEIKDGVTYKGAGADLTVIDGGGVTRAFAAWGDSGATNGQVDADGAGVPNLTGPTGWVLDGMTIQNCVADAASRQDILSVARDLLNNYTGAPYTLAAAQAENDDIEDNPGWFDILSGGADDDLTDAELQAYLDANPVGSAGHLVANDNMNTGGGGLILRNGAAGTVQNCSFLNNQAPGNSGDGGAVNTSGSGVALTIDNCEFIGNSCDDGGGALRMSSASACTITGTIFTENQAVVGSGDGGAIMTANPGTTLTVDNCEFNSNSCIDAGGALRLGATESTCTITGTTFTENYIVEGSGDGGAIRVTGDDSTYVLTDCSFIGNTAADDGAAVRYGPDRAELTMTNCSFIGNGKAADGTVVGDDGVLSCNDDDAGPVTIQNCLFADNACNDDRLVELKAAFSVLNCTFIGNVAGDKALIAVRGRDWDSTGDGVDDVTTDDSIIANCLFINNTMLSDSNVIGDTRNDVFAPTVINCLFFGNLDGTNPASNTDNNSPEVGTIDVSAVTDAAQIVVDPVTGEYHPAAGSPAIDASDPATATATDIEGTPAVGVRDVGAYEAP